VVGLASTRAELDHPIGVVKVDGVEQPPGELAPARTQDALA